MEPGVRGLFWGELRPRGQWVDGLPTFDVAEPLEQPYTIDQEDWTGEPDVPLPVEQAFELLEVLPARDALLADPEAAVQEMLAWARAYPGLARREPASYTVGLLVLGLRVARLARFQPPVAGTYRFMVSVNGDAPRTFHARTWSAPVQEWELDPAVRNDYDATLNAPMTGYLLNLAGAAIADSLRREPGLQNRFGFEVTAPPDGYLSVRATPELASDGAQVWVGRVGLGIAAGALPGDTLLARVAKDEERRMHRLMDAEEPLDMLARFVVRPDGSATIEQTTRLDDGTVVVVRGERISPETIPTPAIRLAGGEDAGVRVAAR